MNSLFLAWYDLAQKVFVRLAVLADRRSGGGVVKAVFLRRGGGRGELVPGASDLDFFIVLSALSAESEMNFLKTFWRYYFRARIFFPFLGEVLMGEEAEVRQWLESPHVRAFEAHFSWKLLRGEDCRRNSAPAAPEARDIYSEALKAYWEQLQTVLKLRDEHFRAGLNTWHPGAVHFRNGAKAIVDLFRLHYSLTLPEKRREALWRASRLDLLHILPPARYGDSLPRLRPYLSLAEAPSKVPDPFAFFSAFLHSSCRCLHEIAVGLERESESEASEGDWKVIEEISNGNVDRYSLSVRELFAERMLVRHAGFVSRVVLSESSAHLYFLFAALPSLEKFRELIRDLRDVSFSFDRFSLAMPLSEVSFRELERTSLFDTPFHAHARHRESRLAGDGSPQTASYSPAAAILPARMLAKTFAELSFVLRFPPIELEYYLERMVGLVLSLRVASEQKQIAASFHSAWRRYSQRFPERALLLDERLAPFLHAPSPKEAEVWDEIFERLARLDEQEPGRGQHLRGQLESLRARNRAQASSPTMATDLWINLTPFLRMEMAALKEKYFRHRGEMKV